jgi:signal transduction histidine kinase
MTPEVQARVFRPFFSTRPGGTGLGLPTTRKIIEAHGGTIEVQSEIGHGTKFTIRLAAADAPSLAAAAPTRPDGRPSEDQDPHATPG